MALTAEQYQAEAESALTKAKSAASGANADSVGKCWAMIADVYAQLFIETKTDPVPTP